MNKEQAKAQVALLGEFLELMDELVEAELAEEPLELCSKCKKPSESIRTVCVDKMHYGRIRAMPDQRLCDECYEQHLAEQAREEEEKGLIGKGCWVYEHPHVSTASALFNRPGGWKRATILTVNPQQTRAEVRQGRWTGIVPMDCVSLAPVAPKGAPG